MKVAICNHQADSPFCCDLQAKRKSMLWFEQGDFKAFKELIQVRLGTEVLPVVRPNRGSNS